MKFALVLGATLLVIVIAELHYASGKLAATNHIEPAQVTCTSESAVGECFNSQGTFIGFHKDLRKHYAGPVSYSTIRKVEAIACASC